MAFRVVSYSGLRSRTILIENYLIAVEQNRLVGLINVDVCGFDSCFDSRSDCCCDLYTFIVRGKVVGLLMIGVCWPFIFGSVIFSLDREGSIILGIINVQ